MSEIYVIIFETYTLDRNTFQIRLDSWGMSHGFTTQEAAKNSQPFPWVEMDDTYVFRTDGKEFITEFLGTDQHNVELMMFSISKIEISE